MGRKSLIASTLDLFFAGNDTTAVTLKHGILNLLHHPEVQEKVHRELDSVMGARKFASLDDKPNLPYTCAVINEILRKSTVVPDAPRATTSQATIEGYTVPAGTIVYGNLKGIHHDPRFWLDPDTFEPDRFYDKKSKTCETNPNLIPFGVGRRYCFGQALAEKQLFLFFVGLMKAFVFKKAPKETLPDPNAETALRGGLRYVPDYKLLIDVRQ